MPPDTIERSKTVLIVEDEEHIAEALAFIIEDAGYAVLIAHNGKEALGIITQAVPDLVISDLMMPQMSGAQLLEALRAQGKSTLPIVLMSAAGREHIPAVGADATLGKPFEIAEIDALLRRFLA
jgi:DNA-binding response OmpR family regulator